LPAFGWLWFLAAIGPTLYLTAVRRAQAADRYTYQSNIGLYLIAVWSLVHLVLWAARRSSRTGALTAGGLAWAGMAAAMLLVSWRTATYYHDNLARDLRIAMLFPEEPGVWEHMSWVYFRAANRAKEESESALKHGEEEEAARQHGLAVKNYEKASELALHDAELHPWRMTCEALQVVGMSHLRMGREAAAIETLARALTANPRYGKGYARLAQAYEESGDLERAIWAYQRAVRLDPAFKPAAASLAELYRKTQRIDAAEALLRELIAQNSYDTSSTMALCEILIQSGRADEARDRLQALLAHIPKRGAWLKTRTHARTNLAACKALSDKRQAMLEYQLVLFEDPGAVTATVNLAALYAAAGRLDEARILLEVQPLDLPDDPASAINLCDSLTRYGAIYRARSMLGSWLDREPSNGRLLARMAWVEALHGRFDDAARRAEQALALDGTQTLARMAQAMAACARNQPQAAVDSLSAALQQRPWDPADADQQFLGAAQRVSEMMPENPFPYYLAAMVLVEQGKRDAARAFIGFFKQHGADETWQARADELISE
jgi:tetratricopeptide (TPR) repeat protein